MGNGDRANAIGVGFEEDGTYVYVAGSASPASWGSPLHGFGGGSSEAFVAKFNSSNGAIVWNDFLGQMVVVTEMESRCSGEPLCPLEQVLRHLESWHGGLCY